MNGITSRCISFAQGNKDPLQRVNYEFGLVLGVDEFVDEQCYFLEKEYQHNRGLHGYGTVSGLLVSAVEKDISGNGTDIEVQVDPGIGIDQYGRVFVVRTPQCASLLSWLEEQGLDPGDQRIYVVARYDECKTALVPIAGQPCSTSDQNTAPSRILDNFQIDLVLEPPQQPARDAVVNLAEFLSRFRVDPNAPDVGDLGSPSRLAPIIGPTVITNDPAAFISHVDDQVAIITGNAGETIVTIRPQIVESLLNDIFAYWVTEVRPVIEPDLIDPDAPRTADGEPFPPEILLAEIDLVIPDNGDPTLDDIEIDNSTRPYLLHTQLVQELFDVPELAGEGGVPAAQKDVVEFATVRDVSIQRLNLWIHIGEDLDLQPNENIRLLRVTTDAGGVGTVEQLTIGLSEDVPRNTDVSRSYQVRTFVDLNNGDYLLFRFDTDQIRVGGGSQTLSDFIDASPFTYANYHDSQARLFTFHTVDRSESISERRIREIILEMQRPQEPVIPFVTITPITIDELNVREYELWFHLDGFAEKNAGRVDDWQGENLAIINELPGSGIEHLGFGVEKIRDNVYRVLLDQSDDNPRLLRFTFGLRSQMIIHAFHPGVGDMVDFGTLGEYMEKTEQRLEGIRMVSEELDEALVVYVREQGFARGLFQ